MQLFNAVRKHQKTIDDRVKEAGSSERKKAKLLSSVSKKDFIDVLRKTEGVSVVTSKTEKDTVGSLMDCSCRCFYKTLGLCFYSFHYYPFYGHGAIECFLK